SLWPPEGGPPPAQEPPGAPAPSPPFRSPSAEAHALYLRGRWHWNLVTSESCRRAFEYFERALAVDPRCARAHAWLAVTHTYRAIYGWAKPCTMRALALEHAVAAASIDPSLAEVHCALGLIHFYFEWNWKRTEAEYQEAIRLQP